MSECNGQVGQKSKHVDALTKDKIIQRGATYQGPLRDVQQISVCPHAEDSIANDVRDLKILGRSAGE
eukprot:3528355-Amphidinium_carterae.1